MYVLCEGDALVVQVLSHDELDQGIQAAQDNLVIIQGRIDAFLESKCQEWPRLYILEKKALVEIFSLVDIQWIYDKYRYLLLPFSTSFINHGIERDKTVGIQSWNEKVVFNTADEQVSSKDDLTLWFKGLCQALKNKVTLDCKTFMDGNAMISTDLRTPRCCEQSRTFVLNCKFWADLL